MSKRNFKEIMLDKQSLLKGIACAIGGLAVIAGGLFYILVTDLYLLNSSQWLFYGAVCAFGAGLACMLSESLRHRATWFYIVKAAGIVAAILFVVIAFAYKGHCDVSSVVRIKGFTTAKVNSLVSLVSLVSSILGFVGIAFQGCGIVLNLVYGIDD